MAIPIKKSGHKFTYTDYSLWPDDERWELIDGIAYDMSPAPSSDHQSISVILSSKIHLFLHDKPCSVFTAPFDVYFPTFPKQDFNTIDTIVQPDISVICDSSKIINKGCLGAPDLIVEILSPSTNKKDLNEKFHLYEKRGVKEYWVIDPGNKYIEIFHLQSKEENTEKYDNGTIIPPVGRQEENTIAVSDILKGFQIDVNELFVSTW